MAASDLVFRVDQYQVASPEALRCPENKEHGRLGAHISGQYVMCPMPGCDHIKIAISPEMIAK